MCHIGPTSAGGRPWRQLRSCQRGLSQSKCVVVSLQIGSEIPKIIFPRNTRRDEIPTLASTSSHIKKFSRECEQTLPTASLLPEGFATPPQLPLPVAPPVPRVTPLDSTPQPSLFNERTLFGKQLLHIDMQWFRGELVFEAHTFCINVIRKKR